MYINAVANSFMLQLYLWYDIYNIILKIKHKLYIHSLWGSASLPPPPPMKNTGYTSLHTVKHVTIHTRLCHQLVTYCEPHCHHNWTWVFSFWHQEPITRWYGIISEQNRNQKLWGHVCKSSLGICKSFLTFKYLYLCNTWELAEYSYDTSDSKWSQA
jgi:hypothetical protein